MRAFAVLVVALTGCNVDPNLIEAHCTPEALRVAPPGPYVVSCLAKFEGEVQDLGWAAFNTDLSYWAEDGQNISPATSDSGSFGFSMSKADPPQLGMLTIVVRVNALASSDGPASDDIETRVQVVP